MQRFQFNATLHLVTSSLFEVIGCGCDKRCLFSTLVENKHLALNGSPHRSRVRKNVQYVPFLLLRHWHQSSCTTAHLQQGTQRKRSERRSNHPRCLEVRVCCNHQHSLSLIPSQGARYFVSLSALNDFKIRLEGICFYWHIRIWISMRNQVGFLEIYAKIQLSGLKKMAWFLNYRLR